MKKLLLFTLLTLSFAISARSQTPNGVRSQTFTAPGTSTAINLLNTGIAYHKLTWNVNNGTASACSVRLDGSANGTTWGAGNVIPAQVCTSNGSSAVVNSVVNYVRIDMTALTVSAGASVVVTWDGWIVNPAGSGGTVTSISATSPIVVTPNPITGVGTVSCPTCGTGSGTIGGSIADTQVAFGTGVNTIGGTDDLSWDNVGKTLSVNGVAEAIGANATTDSSGAGGNGILANCVNNGTGECDGGVFRVFNEGPSAASNAIGIAVVIEHDSPQTLAQLIGLNIVENISASTGTVAESEGIDINSFTLPASGSITLHSGMRVEDQCVGATPPTTCTGVQIDAQSNGKVALNVGGITSSAAYATATNCSDSAGPAACGSAAAGTVVIDAAATSVVVSTTAVTANSEIFVQFDSSLGARLGITCNVTASVPAITARTAATSFTITIPVAPITNKACYSYRIVN